MTVLSNLFQPKRQEPSSVHALLVKETFAICQERLCNGATTGYIKTELKPTPLGKLIDSRAPKGEENQYWRTVIGHALDELHEAGLVHCDEIGKRRMRGDRYSCAVWREARCAESLQQYCTNFLFNSPMRSLGKIDFPSRMRKYFQRPFWNPGLKKFSNK